VQNKRRSVYDRIGCTRILAAHFRLPSPYTHYIPMGLQYCCIAADQMPLFPSFMVVWLKNTRKFPFFLRRRIQVVFFFSLTTNPLPETMSILSVCSE